MRFPSDTEAAFIRQYALLPIVLQLFQRDLKVIEASPLKIKKPYMILIEQAMRKAQHDLSKAKKSLWRSGIKVYEENRTETMIQWKYLYRGYHQSLGYALDVLKLEVSQMIEFYLRSEKQ